MQRMPNVDTENLEACLEAVRTALFSPGVVDINGFSTTLSCYVENLVKKMEHDEITRRYDESTEVCMPSPRFLASCITIDWLTIHTKALCCDTRF